MSEKTGKNTSLQLGSHTRMKDPKNTTLQKTTAVLFTLPRNTDSFDLCDSFYTRTMSSTDATSPTTTTTTTPTEGGDNFVTRSGAFKSLVKWAFGVCDHDKSGHVGKDELYTGVILVHLQLASKYSIRVLVGWR